MQGKATVRPGDIIRTARAKLGQSQRRFAHEVGSRQSLICKYEQGAIDPPSPLVIQCMHLLALDVPALVSEDDLEALVRLKLRGEDMGAARLAIAQLIRCLPEGSSDRPDDLERS